MVLRRLMPALALIAVACAAPTAPTVPEGAIRVNGTVHHLNLEGGFWAIRSDDGVTYDPIHELASTFQVENLRVTLVGRVRSDMGGVHMVGPIIEVLSIEKR